MAKLTLSNVANISGAESAAIGVINANSDAIETALENTLSRDGTSPNSMGADLDMNNNDILNVYNIDVNTLTIDGVPILASDVADLIAGITPAGLALIDDATADAQLTTLGGGTAGIAAFKAGTETQLRVASGPGTVASIASASTLNLAALPSYRYLVTGTTTVTAITLGNDKTAELRFADALTLTYNATTLILPTGASITTAAGDIAFVETDSSGNVRVTDYVRANGRALAADPSLVGGIASAEANGVLPGNSAATNTANLQALIDSLTFQTVVFEEGTYELNSITLKPGVALRGAGRGKTNIRPGSNSITIFYHLVTSTTKEYFSITDMSFELNGKTAVMPISIDGNTDVLRASRITLKNLGFSGNFAACIHLRYCANTTIIDCISFGETNAYFIDKCGDTNIISCHAQNFPGTTAGVGFWIIGGAGATDEGVRLVGCVTNGPGYGLIIDGQEWGTATGCSFSTDHSGALSLLNNVANWKFTGCEFSTVDAQPGAILSTGCADIVFSGCQFILNNYGIYLRGTRISVVGCGFHDNTNNDIYIDTTTQSIITANQCHSTGVAASVASSANCNHTLVSQNVGNGTFAVSGTGAILADNITY